MLLKNIPTLDVKTFTWMKSMGKWTGTCEASDLPRSWMTRVYDDACDVGFYVKGETQTTLFTLVDRYPAVGPEIDNWEFASGDGSCRITVFND